MKHLSFLLALAGALAGPSLSAQNTNQDAPTAKHSLQFGSGSSIEVSYRQLQLAGGQSLKGLMSKGERGNALRKFYNEQYLPQFLQGKLRVKQPITLGGHALPAGSYGFTFRIDDELVWHFIVTNDEDEEVCALALEADQDRKTLAERLVVEPIADADQELKGHLEVRFGPLASKLAFGPPAAADEPPKAGGKPADSDAGKGKQPDKAEKG